MRRCLADYKEIDYAIRILYRMFSGSVLKFIDNRQHSSTTNGSWLLAMERLANIPPEDMDAYAEDGFSYLGRVQLVPGRPLFNQSKSSMQLTQQNGTLVKAFRYTPAGDVYLARYAQCWWRLCSTGMLQLLLLAATLAILT